MEGEGVKFVLEAVTRNDPRGLGSELDYMTTKRPMRVKMKKLGVVIHGPQFHYSIEGPNNPRLANIIQGVQEVTLRVIAEASRVEPVWTMEEETLG